MDMSHEYDVIVVGAGIFGSCAAYHSQKLGQKTLLLEQFNLHHTLGSSHGKSRITRYAHMESEYIPLVDDSYKQISQMENTRHQALWRKTGLLWVASNNDVESMSRILRTHGASHEVLKGSEVAHRYSQFKFDDENSGLVDPMGGVLFADLILNAFQEEFVKLGGVLNDQEELLAYIDGPKLQLDTTKANYSCRKLIIAVGSWITKVVPSLPTQVEVTEISVCYWNVKAGQRAELAQLGQFPVFVGTNNGQQIYALPAVDHVDVIKLCTHRGQTVSQENLAVQKSTFNMEFVEAPSKYIEKYLPVFHHESAFRVDTCKYTNSVDSHYIIDFLPGSKNVVLGGCGSGCGFKVGPAIGKVLAELAVGQKPSFDISFFSLARFAEPKIEG